MNHRLFATLVITGVAAASLATAAPSPVVARGGNREHVETILTETAAARNDLAEAKADIYMGKLKVDAVDSHYRKQIDRLKREHAAEMKKIAKKLEWYEKNPLVGVAVFIWQSLKWFVFGTVAAYAIAVLLGLNPGSLTYRFSQTLVRFLPLGNIVRFVTRWVFGVKSVTVPADSAA